MHAHDCWWSCACRDFLRQHRGCFSTVIACDARDTLFQANVFTLPIVQATQHLPVVLVGTEDPPRGAGFKDTTVSLAEQEINKNWLDTCFGASSYNHSERRSIVCSGFLAGNAAAMEALSSTIIDVLKDRCCTAGQVTGLDQGIVNWLVHWAPAMQGFRLEVVPNGDLVFNLGLTVTTLGNAVTLGKDSKMVNPYTHKPFPVIHQYDRVASYVPVARQMYPEAL